MMENHGVEGCWDAFRLVPTIHFSHAKNTVAVAEKEKESLFVIVLYSSLTWAFYSPMQIQPL